MVIIGIGCEGEDLDAIRLRILFPQICIAWTPFCLERLDLTMERGDRKVGENVVLDKDKTEQVTGVDSWVDFVYEVDIVVHRGE
jgi:hypothetical protein